MLESICFLHSGYPRRKDGPLRRDARPGRTLFERDVAPQCLNGP